MPAEQRSVVRLQDRRELLVPVLVIAHRDSGHPTDPELRVLPDLEQRDVAAPRVAGDDRSLRVGDPTRDEIGEAGVDVLELRPSDVPDQDVAPLAPVPDRAAVVDHAHCEPGFDVCLHLGLPAVEVEPRRPAVDEHHHRERPAGVVRGGVEAVDALAVRVLEVPRLVRAALRSPLRRRHELHARVVDGESLPVPLLVQEPHPPVRPDARLPDVARIGGDPLESAAREVVPGQARPAFEHVHEQERGGVGPPVVDEHLTLDVEIEVGPFAGLDVPDSRSRLTRALVVEGEALIAADGRPALRYE